MDKLNSVKEQLVNMFTQLGGIATAVILGFAGLVAVIASVYFFKKDRSGSEEGKGALMRVGTAIIVAVGAFVGVSAFSAFVASVIK